MRISASRLAIQTVIGAHHRSGVSFCDGRPERRQVCLAQIAFSDRGIEPVPLRLGAGVYGVMLGRRDNFQILLIVALQSLDEFDSEPAREVRIFAVGFLAAAPARVAKDIDVWRPEGETIKPAPIPAPLRLVILRARLFRDDSRDTVDQLRVERCSKTDGLREYCRNAESDAVQGFVPPVV